VIFHSLAFVAFFVITVALYWRLPHRGQNLLLLVASYVFYGWIHPWFLALIFATTFVDYWSAVGIERWPAHRRRFLWFSVGSNIGLLGFFKYFGFFADNVAAAAALFGWELSRPILDIFLPVGISFYTFQSMSYTIDVYRGHTHARHGFLNMMVFVSFFPHLVAGPIMRATNLLPQVERERRFSVPAARDATLLIAWGFFKKLVIADNVGVIANKVFALQAPDFYLLWAGVFAFCIQIYADFSAYTDIARGTAKWLGFELIRNFDHPYLATGPADFWRRWNISLTTWFRDYVFFPLSFALSRRIDEGRVLGMRADLRIYAAATMITFLLSGLWHGASWNYVVWGGYHGLLLVIARASASIWKPRRRARRYLAPFQWAGMFVLTNVGWLIFREPELGMIWRDLTLNPFDSTMLQHQAGNYLLILALFYSLPLWAQSLWTRFVRIDLTAALDAGEGDVRFRRVIVQACLAGVMFAAILVLRSYTSLDFIYFQF
jgi:D-alanyl-lipoteichoic acid acyltransferase DltB (MBOAT superfamily)